MSILKEMITEIKTAVMANRQYLCGHDLYNNISNISIIFLFYIMYMLHLPHTPTSSSSVYLAVYCPLLEERLHHIRTHRQHKSHGFILHVHLLFSNSQTHHILLYFRPRMWIQISC